MTAGLALENFAAMQVAEEFFDRKDLNAVSLQDLVVAINTHHLINFRFNDLVKEMAKRSQIIVVTHNKYTMEVASKLYGVTMEEKGVSKMVSVNLGDAVNVAAG